MHGLIFGFKAECEYSVLNSGAIDMEVKSNHVFVTVHSVHSNVAKISFQIACGNGILACMSRDFGIFMPKHLAG